MFVTSLRVANGTVCHNRVIVAVAVGIINVITYLASQPGITRTQAPPVLGRAGESKPDNRKKRKKGGNKIKCYTQGTRTKTIDSGNYRAKIFRFSFGGGGEAERKKSNQTKGKKKE